MLWQSLSYKWRSLSIGRIISCLRSKAQLMMDSWKEAKKPDSRMCILNHYVILLKVKILRNDRKQQQRNISDNRFTTLKAVNSTQCKRLWGRFSCCLTEVIRSDNSHLLSTDYTTDAFTILFHLILTTSQSELKPC